ncbi:tetratricopeptide repeat protein [Synechococcus sp. HB1133]|uniref:tetratricopeptide repeat protein n=1 Tax=unclassified Synechococcus TaxID=2626047 RepID=UPI00140CD556|nr:MULTISPECIES: tetratricopeptide repeat protein [unclassified Synechococcus]MCB4394718.1 tetratricopeptide repeat protein [Synechococcus sp. PH41509]MCB4422055.1 tetratricopeptide repeat protein [Synechococcus sp. HB1133]MCB4429997.1 tetratricopeptide repeat protein [Synechococcus sp. HBA1120]NHI80998.1 tetratricopeptide repeat protein [Synechococcus sp. HB1133]
MIFSSFANQVAKIRLKKRIFIYLLALFLIEAPWAVAAPAVNNKYSNVDLYLDLGQTQKAASLMRGFKDKDDPEYHYYQGRVSSMFKHNQKSVQHFQKAISLNPKYAKAFAALAMVKGRMGKFQDALKDLDRAIAIDPGYAKAYSNRGVTRGALQQNQAAISDFSQAIRLDPRLADAYRNRGITREMTGDLKGACADWKIASALGQEGPGQWYAAQCKN